MAELQAKVNMSLDEIIKLERKKKMNQRGGGARGRSTSMGRNPMRGRSASRGRNQPNQGGRGGRMRSASRGPRGNMRGGGGMRGRISRRGGPRRFSQNDRRPYTNGVSHIPRGRSRSKSLNRPNMNGPMRGGRGGFRGMNRSRSRSNVRYGAPRPVFTSNGFNQMRSLSRTNSMPDLSDPNSVHNRLGYQNPGQIAYRNRVKRAKNTLIQRQNKALLMQSAISLANNHMAQDRRFGVGNLHADQLMRAQRRAQYDQKLIRINNARGNYPMTMNYINNPYAQHPSMAYYGRTRLQSPSPPRRQMQREQSPFQQSLATLQQSLKAAAKAQQAPKLNARQRRARSRSRSRARSKVRGRSIINLHDTTDLEDRSFSEVMYSLSNNFGVTGRTLNDRFSLF